MSFKNPQHLVETDWLENNLSDPNLRIIDCTFMLKPDDHGVLGNGAKEAWTEGHIPGSVFVDLKSELSDLQNNIPFMMPSTDQFAAVLSRLGVGEGTRVIVYDSCGDKWANIWAARLWWMLRVHGFENVAILNGGFHKWKFENKLISKEVVAYPPARFISRFRRELIAGKKEVLDSISKNEVCLINALTSEEHDGIKSRYGRAGHIPSSVNVPAVSLVDPLTRSYLPAQELYSYFQAAGAFKKERVIAYCGGGIAATSDAFVLALLGKENVAVYDGSLYEWANDEAPPLVIS